MKVKLSNFSEHTYQLKTSFLVGDYELENYKVFKYTADFNGVLVNGEIPALPLFYGSQRIDHFNELELSFNKNSIDLEQKLFAQKISLENAPNNLVFSIEQLIISYLTIIKECPIEFSSEAPVALINQLNSNVKNNTVIKIKIGRDSISAEKKRIKDLFDKGHKLRLDGNRMLSAPQLEELLEGLSLENIEYIEEPFSSYEEWENFSLKHKVGLALDEGLQSCLESNTFPTNTVAFIIKPSLSLCVSGILRLRNNKVIEDRKVVISSSFETGQTFNLLIHLASIFDTHHGLGTLGHLILPKSEQNMFNQVGDKIHGHPISYFQI